MKRLWNFWWRFKDGLTWYEEQFLTATERDREWLRHVKMGDVVSTRKPD